MFVILADCHRCVQVSELDPDASGRQRRPLHPENVADEERILSRLWRLVRAGLPRLVLLVANMHQCLSARSLICWLLEQVSGCAVKAVS